MRFNLLVYPHADQEDTDAGIRWFTTEITMGIGELSAVLLADDIILILVVYPASRHQICDRHPIEQDGNDGNDS